MAKELNWVQRCQRTKRCTKLFFIRTVQLQILHGYLTDYIIVEINSVDIWRSVIWTIFSIDYFPNTIRSVSFRNAREQDIDCVVFTDRISLSVLLSEYTKKKIKQHTKLEIIDMDELNLIRLCVCVCWLNSSWWNINLNWNLELQSIVMLFFLFIIIMIHACQRNSILNDFVLRAHSCI